MTLTTVHDGGSTATFDLEGLYRYRLTRTWSSTDRVCWILLNPSTATARQDDATIRRVVGFSRSWGYGSAVVVNLFGLRSSDPDGLDRPPDPVGPDNDSFIAEAGSLSAQIVVAWGVHGSTINPTTGARRDHEVLDLLERTRLVCLGHTAAGQPRHPLYMTGCLLPIPFRDSRPAQALE